MRDDNEGVMERGWKTFMRVTKYCIKGGVYILLNMILVNRENPTLNGVDYHKAVRVDCSRLSCFTGQAVLPAFTLNNCQISEKNYERNLTEKCSAFWGSSQRLSLWRRDCIQQVRVLLLEVNKMFIATITKVPYLSSYWSISIHSPPSQHFPVSFCHRSLRLSSRFSRLKFVSKFHLRSLCMSAASFCLLVLFL